MKDGRAMWSRTPTGAFRNSLGQSDEVAVRFHEQHGGAAIGEVALKVVGVVADAVAVYGLLSDDDVVDLVGIAINN